MPIGSFTAVPHIARRLVLLRPGHVLDLGMGSGFLGAVVRQWVDVGTRPWKTFLVGVEAWADYRNPLWDLYNLVYVETIQAYLGRHSDRFDCVLLGDVLEHFAWDEGVEILRQLKDRVAPGGLLIVATPAVFHDQAAVNGNPFERHRSLWEAGQLEALGFETILSGAEPQVAFLPTILSCWECPPGPGS